MTAYDLRKSFHDSAIVTDGALYRFGNIVQVWWTWWVVNGKRERLATPVSETWTAPSIEQAIVNFDSMKERWNA